MNKLYWLYSFYIVVIILLAKYVIFTPEGGFLLMLGMAFIPPVIISFIPLIFVKKKFLEKILPASHGHEFSLAFWSMVHNVGVMTLYVMALSFFVSFVFNISTNSSEVKIFGVAQTHSIMFFEVCTIILLFALVSKRIDYHIVHAIIASSQSKQGRRELWYANVLSYVLLTGMYFVWQTMIFYQWPNWLWSWL